MSMAINFDPLRAQQAETPVADCYENRRLFD